MHFKKSLLLLAFSVSTSLASAQETEVLLKPCVECHGLNGIATKPGVPHLDGQMAEYINKTLRSYTDGIRNTAVAQHKNIPVETRKAMGEHYAAQKVKREKSPTDSALVARGDELYQSRCADCHPDNGRETDKDAPLMATQNVDYLTLQSIAFRKGDRRFATMMDDAFRGLSEADLTAVSHFFASQDQVAAKAGKKRRKKD